MKIGDTVRVERSHSGIYEGKIIEFRGGNTALFVEGIGIVSINQCKLIREKENTN
jgi:hypothetical protein